MKRIMERNNKPEQKKTKENKIMSNETMRIIENLRNGDVYYGSLPYNVRIIHEIIEIALEFSGYNFALLIKEDMLKIEYILKAIKNNYPRAFLSAHEKLKNDPNFIEKVACLNGRVLKHVDPKLVTPDVLEKAILSNGKIPKRYVVGYLDNWEYLKIFIKNGMSYVAKYINFTVKKAKELMKFVDEKDRNWLFKTIYDFFQNKGREDEIVTEFLKDNIILFLDLPYNLLCLQKYQFVAVKSNNCHYSAIWRVCGYYSGEKESGYYCEGIFIRYLSYDPWLEYIRIISEKIGVKQTNEFSDVVFKFNE
jgi:hypothetical protein